jgi:GMP synthase-like glutamine amidotransferase
MKTLLVLQHTEAEHLGYMEDHFESRNIRFRYVRPFAPGNIVPFSADGMDGLVILGAGAFGIVSGNLLPSMGAELRLAKDFLARDLPVIGVGLGAAILAVAAGGGARDAPLRFEVERAFAEPGALDGDLPASFPSVSYLRDEAVLPTSSSVLARDEAGNAAIFAVGKRSLGFVGHPGIKSAMVEDLIMEFDETPPDTASTLVRLREAQFEIADTLSRMMVGVIRHAGLMEP